MRKSQIIVLAITVLPALALIVALFVISGRTNTQRTSYNRAAPRSHSSSTVVQPRPQKTHPSRVQNRHKNASHKLAAPPRVEPHPQKWVTKPLRRPTQAPPSEASREHQTITIKAADFSAQRNVQIGVLPYGDDVIHNGPPYGPAPDWVQYDFQAVAGTYELWVEYAALEARPVQLSVNGRVVMQNALATATGGWELSYQRLQYQTTVHLVDGHNTLSISRSNAFPHIRRIELRTVSIEAQQTQARQQPRPRSGKIVYIRSGAIWIMSSDGTNQRELVSSGNVAEPRIGNGVVAFISNHRVYQTDENGSAPRPIPNSDGVLEFDLKPDGTEIVLTYVANNNFDLYTMNIDGSNRRLINSGNLHQAAVDWGQDGYIYLDQSSYGNAYSQKIYRIPEQGVNNPTLLVRYFSQYACEGGNAAGKVVFLYNQPSPMLRIISSNGSNQSNITNSPAGIQGRLGFDYQTKTIYYSFQGQIREINVDGSNDHLLVSGIRTGDFDYGD